MLANFSNENLAILKATVLGMEEEMSESVMYNINNESESNSDGPKKPPRRKKNEKQMHGKLDSVIEHRVGSKVSQVDALSRHVGTVIHGGTSDKVNVPSKGQKRPPVLNRHREPVATNASFSQIAKMFSTGENQRELTS